MPEEEKKKDDLEKATFGFILLILAVWAISNFFKRHTKLLRAVSAFLVVVFGIIIIQGIISDGFYGYKEKFDSIAGHSQGTFLIVFSILLLLFLFTSLGVFTPCQNCLKWNVLLKNDPPICKKCGFHLEPPPLSIKNEAQK